MTYLSNQANEQPMCRFYRIYKDAPLPRRADPSADGMIPARGYRYCVSSSMASAYGWYMYPPLDFALIWNGRSIAWTYAGAENWYPLRPAAQYPGFRESFRRNAPERLKMLAPTCLSASRDKAMVQIMLGYVAKTEENVALLIRPPANIARTQDYEHFEGILHTGEWRGAMITNIELNEKNSPVIFSKRYPLVQVQPVIRECYVNPSFEVGEFTDMTEEHWNSYERVARANADLSRKPGHHSVEVRKRLRGETKEPTAVDPPEACPFHHAHDQVTAA